jgi:hypothetical protein
MDTEVRTPETLPLPPEPEVTPTTPEAPALEAATPAAPEPEKATKNAKPAKAPKVKPAKEPKVKLVRDSFTMPKDDYALIETLKTCALHFHRPAKKSELLRAGLHALAALPESGLESALNALRPVKTGRPRGEGRRKK